MCGIAGIVGRLNESNRIALRKMNRALSHRGPDGEGYWESSADDREWGVMLAHRRLSILDLSPAAAQPMVDPVTGHVAVINGEIYNYVELRARLSAEGQKFQSTGDTAVMLRVVSIYGCRAIRLLRGMFAFAVWNTDKRKLILARDPLGIKPLYFARNSVLGADWSLIFASELRAILASELLGKPKLNPRATASMVWNGFIVSPETAVERIETVWPGQFYVFDSTGSEEYAEDYWSMPHNKPVSAIDESYLANTLEQSVRLHLASDVPLGIFLSSGVDSATVANVAHKTSQSPVHTFTLAFEEQEYNEATMARRIAAAIGTQHQELILTEQRFIAQLDTALGSLDQPSFDGLNTYYMSQAVRDAGFKVALIGTGGDELFGGYASFRDLPTLLRFLTFAKWLPRSVTAQLATLVSRVAQPSSCASVQPQTRWAKLPAMVEYGDNLLSLYQLCYALFLPEFRTRLLTDQVAASADGIPAPMRSRLVNEIDSRSPLSAVSVLEQRLFLGERLLRDTDATSMAASIEVRLPLVDQVVVERTCHLDDQERYYPISNKALLRRIGLRGLDPSLFNHPKKGFVLPYDRWIRASLGKLMDETMRDPAIIEPVGLSPETVRQLWQAFLAQAPGLYWSRVWAIYVFIRWCHRYKVFL
jgi:asparagine synthase (glutamine-hydrolysing)